VKEEKGSISFTLGKNCGGGGSRVEKKIPLKCISNRKREGEPNQSYVL
jgi:hypothetical protein